MTFDALFVPAALREAVSDEAWLRAMLDAERELAAAEARVGLISQDAADVVAAACRSKVDLEELLADGRDAGNPVEPLVRRLRQTAEQAHWGATSQDILDTAAALVARNATALIVDDLAGAAHACAELADEYRDAVMAGRTLLQQAVPITFGLKAAGWLVGLEDVRRRLEAAQLPAQLGGAAGTLAPLGPRGREVLEEFAARLDLPAPPLPWHTRRLPVAGLGAALSLAAGFAAKIALDVALLAQTEVAEVREPTEGRSSTMPHKRNPVGSALTRACTARAQAAAGLLLSALPHEHERAAGAWHAEWGALSDALAYSGGAASSLRATLAGLEVDTDRMRANLREETLSEAKRFDPDASAPEAYLGSTAEFIDRALEAFRSE